MKPVIVALACGVVVGACAVASSSSGTGSAKSASGSRTLTAPTVVARVSPRPRRSAAAVPLGALPQTHQLPSARSPVFKAEMAKLWAGVVADSPRTAMAAFFPMRAYVRLKAVADPAGDYRNRLVAGYRLDIAAAHALVAGGERLLAVNVPTSYAHWVPPGVCYNRIGYYEVPNARVVYAAPAGTRSFGIASMISWRGVWYVVHLGSVVSPGTVDDPGSGPGVSAPSSTC